MTLTRRRIMFAAAAPLLGMRPLSAAATPPPPVIYRNAGCGCCHLWGALMARASFLPATPETG
jgi:hypothetical protein